MDFATISQNVNTDEEVVKKYNKCIQNVYLVKGFILLPKMLETSIKKMSTTTNSRAFIQASKFIFSGLSC